MRNLHKFNEILLLVLYLSYGVGLAHSGFIFKISDYEHAAHNVTARFTRQADCEFRCTSGECIGIEEVCDGPTNCSDGSDETKKECETAPCPGYLFKCKYGACIQANQVCDGIKHCADNSDEEAPSCTAPKATGSCTNAQFRCNDGSCIDNLDTCDGKRDCADGSDETEETCAGLTCPGYVFRCAYGACVVQSAKCNGVRDCADGSDEIACPTTGPVTPPVTPPTIPVTPPSSGCVLPPHVPNGRFALVAGGVYKENTIVSVATGIQLTCDMGYTDSLFKIFSCIDNDWIPDIKGSYCTRTCPPLKESDSYTAVCRHSGRIVSCSENPIEGTEAHITCNPFFTYGVRAIPYCQDGTWDPYPAPCDAECGQKIVNAQTLVVGGSDALPGEYPWIVAIYNNESKHICGGTIISRFFIVTAAHCFTNKENAENIYTIAAGKYYRDINKPENTTQIRKIKRLLLHEDYKGVTTKYRDDIALLEVEKLIVTDSVQPVCVDWDNNYEARDFVEDNPAVVAGWGLTVVGSTPAEILKKLVVPFKTPNTCEKFMDPDFYKKYYSSDKICAGYKDEGVGVCNGDSGGGLYFRSQETTFYVRGIVSLAPRGTAGCDTNHFALYTKVSKYLDWISGITRKRV